MNKDMKEAIEDCKWALKLSETALREHFMHWCGNQSVEGWTENDFAYANAMNVIRNSYKTESCYLTKEK